MNLTLFPPDHLPLVTHQKKCRPINQQNFKNYFVVQYFEMYL
jgi:hypothetical protein